MCSPATTAQVGVVYTLNCTATGGTGAYTWITASLPAWLSLTTPTATTAKVSGTPMATDSGAFGFTLTVKDSATPVAVPYSAPQGGTVAGAPVITCVPSTTPQEQGLFYSTTCSVSGGTPGYNWITTGSVPPGLGLSSSSGTSTTLSGTPSHGTFTYGVKVTDNASTPQSATAQFNNVTIADALAISCTTNASPTAVNVAYSNMCTASNGKLPYSWSIASGALPAGLSFSAGLTTFSISGGPLAAAVGLFNYRIQVTDGAGAAVHADYSGSIQSLPVVNCLSNAGPVQVNVPYFNSCTVNGGTPPYTWLPGTGTLPNGIDFNPKMGNITAISGTPTTAAHYMYSVQVKDSAKDSNGNDASQSASTPTFTGDIVPPLTVSCTPSTGPTEFGVNYLSLCTVSGGTTPYNWSVSSGAIPGGLNLVVNPSDSTRASIGGGAFNTAAAPTAAVTYTFKIRVQDKLLQFAEQAFGGQVLAAPTVSCTPTSGPTEDGLFYRTVCTGSNGATGPNGYNWTITPITTTPWLAVNGAGALSGGAVTAQGTTITIQGTPPPTSGATGNAFNFVIVMKDVAVDSTGAPAPQSPAAVTFTGTTAAAPRISCADSSGANPGQASLGPPEVGVTYQAVCKASAGVPPYTWPVPAGLPPGLSLSVTGTGSDTATISGTPTSPQSFNYTVSFTDANGIPPAGGPNNIAPKNIFAGNIAATPSATCDPILPPLQVGVPYSTTCVVKGGTAPYAWSLVGQPSVPTGLTLTQDPNKGFTATVSGKVTGGDQAAQYQVKVADSAVGVTTISIGSLNFPTGPQPQAAIVPFNGSIKGPLQLSCPSTQGPVEVGVPYSAQCTATGGTQPYAVVLQGTVAAGINASLSGGAITLSGTPLVKGAYSFTVAVNDAALTPCSGAGTCPAPQTAVSSSFSGNVAAAPSVNCDSSAGPFELGLAFSYNCLALDGTPPYAWTIASGGKLPAGLTMTPAGNKVTVSGKPTAAGPYRFALQVADSLQSTAQGPLISNTIAPVLKIAPGHMGDFPLKGNGTVSMTVSNATSDVITGATTIGMTLPPGLTPVTAASDGSWNCTTNGQNINCTRTNNAPLGAQGSYPPVNVSVSISDQACSGPMTTSASAQLDNLQQATGSDTINATGCLSITKVHQNSFPAGGVGQYTLNVSNNATVPVSGTITVSDQLSPRLSVDPQGAAGDGWTCNSSQSQVDQTWTVTCSRTDSVPAKTQLPPITVPVDVTAGACGFVTDPAAVQLNGLVQGSSKDPTSIAGTGCLVLSGNFSPSVGTVAPVAGSGGEPAPAAGAGGTYSLKVSNVGEGTISAAISVVLALPDGFTVAGTGDATWQCDGNSPLTCSHSAPIAGSGSTVLTVQVGGSVSCGVLTAQASLNFNGVTQTTSIPGSIPGTACLTLSRSLQGLVQAGGKGTYTLTVTNPDVTTRTAPAVELKETLPAGVTPANISSFADTGWTCAINQQDIDCTRSDDLAASSSYPPIIIDFNAATSACPAFTSTAFLSANGNLQSADTVNAKMTGCLSLQQSVLGPFGVNQSASYALTPTYLGEKPISGTLTVKQTLPGGLVPVSFTGPGGAPFGSQDWTCAISQDSTQTFTCSRPATGTYTPILVTVNVGLDACPVASTQAALQLDGAPQSQSNSVLIPIIGTCPGTKLKLTGGQDTNPPGGVFAPNLAGGATYRLIVTNTSTDPATGSVVIADQFNPGLRPTAVNGSGWACDPVAQVITCNRQDALAAGAAYPPLLISVAIDPGACPSAQDSVLLTLGGKTQATLNNTVNLRGCINLSPSSLSYLPVTLGGTPAKQSVTLTASDKDPLAVKVHQLPAASVFSLASTACPDLASGKDCVVPLSQGKSVTIDVLYKPVCIGTHADAIQFQTDVPSAGSIPLTGKAILQGLSFVQLPGGQNLAGTSVAPNTSINVGLNAALGYCIGGAGQVNPRVLFSQFSRVEDSRPIKYDQDVTACPSGVDSCLAALKTGTVAGDITLGAQFTDANGQDVGYAADATAKVTVPPAQPVITDVNKGSVSASSFVLNVTGYSTPRKNTQACFKFTAAPGTVLNTTGLNNCYAGQDIAIWYDRSASIPTGSQFTTAVTFSFAGDATAIGTVESWLSNDLGESGHLCMDFKTGTAKAGACQ
jgi:uncharacterized repeat protein (TIGR01451 family)